MATPTITLENLREIWYSILREEQNTSAYPLVLMDMLLNSAQNRICNGTVINPMNGQAVRKWQLPFLGTSAMYSNVSQTTLSTATTVGATSLSITDTTNFPSTGSLYINGNIITYTWKTATTFTGITNVLFAHLAGSDVSVAFTLPTTYGSITNITYNNQYKLAWKLYDDIWEDLNSIKTGNYNYTNAQWFRSQREVAPFYTIIDGTYFVIFNRNNTGDQIHLRYEKLATEMTVSGSLATIPDAYSKATIPYLAIGEMLYNRWEETRGGEIINFALGQCKEMYSFYNNSSFESINWVQFKTWHGKLNI